MSIAALIVAAGRGTRAGGDLPKQWQVVAGRRVADWTLAAFTGHPRIDHVVMVIHPDDVSRVPDGVETVPGGATRDASVRAGLEALEARGVTRVLIHDVARACVTAQVIDAVLDMLDTHAGAAPGLAVTDALWRGAATVTGTQPRDGLFRAQTPQGFHFGAILAAHRAHTGGAADDVEVARAAGITVAITDGSDDNIKITRPQDFDRAAAILKGQQMQAPDIRLGNGYDVHRFGPGDHVVLCGVKVPHDRALQGHSDADVGMHAITDAIYGALAQGDIGRHFPPSDPQWKGVESQIFLRNAVDLARNMGFGIGNIDCTLVCEHPKIRPHAAAMQAALASITGIAVARISVKATTSERLGFTGREEGIAAIATATLVAS
ncbi:bifunctional 2-C-methyl-D-erythritol 4-phosphate cytidylyltransferase/2-C-methyl-D-erythritol 2,4-cyclodiphosphate synthase [Lutimaribacter sp. EGI FJ00015]|uniref:Bifunctional 2-C-methyl-D-erythritol 4-phosphate cytidylyltransferase/2-C-methyl-D-erythritol 2,4-cyclodiphosphate synthase n=1 Tax=Lutimaribacter degradans TaxID=2945989 RepID=A0ACC5ZT16_9RHOB|nr:bifunctional 2-C-methyl-D-erythritol 4-phosphate cytidylyltransferase/2-C-methyl-D-erythritol 2,4-cyclodiphosphate synthase [Lutimaribacter sp. EGI FJ00013]MCM2561093.1 bifunctional 2-C-methyl-D-erythritol 4-phosphate cytidylyltransferase/2-C-methyl-D-erythritol 2,4-cyclodiphosphate synthase [Lutimaribacter sp. EGI FJ00013]MCO0611958.1 bifunctional 2-C-methyl-D-erythritol 4-phosphate cytidylyltransferase/2-C-methyl-D-erythritol 2,4-cyclodiphosphate synthase [Lutimaribacter sp. EGI FJ00015]MCO